MTKRILGTAKFAGYLLTNRGILCIEDERYRIKDTSCFPKGYKDLGIGNRH
jgi:hypothetical protein